MSESDGSESNIPPREVCESRCQEFAEVTGTDTALAMFYLQDRDWDLQRSINSYFEENLGSSPAEAKSTVDTVTANKVDEAAANKMDEAASKKVDDPEPHRIRVMTWNIDGLDQNNLETRTKAVCKVIQQERPHAVFLQELVPRGQELIESLCPQYQLLASNGDGYYTAILLHCDGVMYRDHAITPFFTSKMGRSLLMVKACIKGVEFLLMTSHLESTKSHADERVRQLRAAFKELREARPSLTVLFGGDLNLRDEELVKAGGIPDKTYDMWEATGKRDIAKFTWDTRRNDNLEMSGNFKPRCRFDRMYLRSCAPDRAVKPVYFELVGIERIPNCQRFPSDHWGILTHFDKIT